MRGFTECQQLEDIIVHVTCADLFHAELQFYMDDTLLLCNLYDHGTINVMFPL